MKSILLVGACLLASAADSPQLAGDWQGSVTFNGVSQTLAVHLQAAGAGWKGSMDAGLATGIPLHSIAIAGPKLTFEVGKIAAAYEGTYDLKTGIIGGTWSQGGLKLPLDLHRVNAGPRPQEPKPPFPYIAENVAYENPQAPGVRLAGTLTLPKGAGPFHAVLLITGSGAQNRDEELMGHKPFLVLADYLTRRGIAVLRVDDRGTAESTGNFAASTTQDFASDAMAGVRFLLARPEIDKKNVGLIGHSEGGIIAPMVAVKMPEIAFIVMLAGSALPGAEIIEDQVYQSNLLAGISPEIAAVNREFERKILTLVMNDPDPEKKVLALADGDPALQQNLKKQLPGMRSPWYQLFLKYDPRTALRQVKCPVLALNGSKDSQVSPEQNLPAIEAALKAGGNRDATVQTVPGVNHLFQTARSGALSEYREIEETMSPKVLQIIGDWILTH